jgi:hypothetical protein
MSTPDVETEEMILSDQAASLWVQGDGENRKYLANE